jgi:hypothetical protein
MWQYSFVKLNSPDRLVLAGDFEDEAKLMRRITEVVEKLFPFLSGARKLNLILKIFVLVPVGISLAGIMAYAISIYLAASN